MTERIFNNEEMDTATLETEVSRLPAQSCGTAFQVVLGKQTLAENSLNACLDLFVWALRMRLIVSCDYLFKLHLFKFSYLLSTYFHLITQLHREQ